MYISPCAELWFSYLCPFDDWSALNTARSCIRGNRFEGNHLHTTHCTLCTVPLCRTFLRLSISTTLVVQNREDKVRLIKTSQTSVLSPSHSGALTTSHSSSFRLIFVAITSRCSKICNRIRFEEQFSINISMNACLVIRKVLTGAKYVKHAFGAPIDWLRNRYLKNRCTRATSSSPSLPCNHKAYLTKLRNKI